MSQPNENLLDEHLAAENAHNLDRIMATYGTSPLILLNGQRIEGHAAIREFHRSFGFGEGGSFSDVHADERARHRSSDAIVIEQTLTGLHSGTWMQHAPTGRRFQVQVCTVYRFDGRGMLSAEHFYADLGWIERQLTHPT